MKVDSLDIVKHILGKECNLRIPSIGMSMSPILQDNVIIVKPAKATDVSIGDIILYIVRENMIAHRVVKRYIKNAKIMLITKGDSNSSFDKPINPEHVLGKVIAIEKNNVTINLENKIWRIANYMIARYSLLSLSIYRRICFLKRVVIGNRENRFVYIGSKVLSISLSLFPMLLIRLGLCFSINFTHANGRSSKTKNKGKWWRWWVRTARAKRL